GATVSGHWSGATSDSDVGLTDAAGQVTLESNKVKAATSGTTFTFTVDTVALAGRTYDPASNVETSDSITVP
ncbi:MAG: subtilisin, partial [Armatimonadota bacterium]